VVVVPTHDPDGARRLAEAETTPIETAYYPGSGPISTRRRRSVRGEKIAGDVRRTEAERRSDATVYPHPRTLFELDVGPGKADRLADPQAAVSEELEQEPPALGHVIEQLD